MRQIEEAGVSSGGRVNNELNIQRITSKLSSLKK
jgi:hypothetical protein